MKSFTRSIIPVGLIAALVAFVFLLQLAFTPTEECAIHYITFNCDLSGWMSLILGDVAISLLLALFWNFIASRNSKKIDENGTAIKNNKISIQKILIEQHEIRQRRQTYVIQSFKNQFSVILLFLGIACRLSENKSDDIFENTTLDCKEFERLLQKCKNTLNLSIDVIDPMLVEQIEVFLTLIEQKVLQNKKLLDYDNIKNTIMKLTSRLDEYSDGNKVLK